MFATRYVLSYAEREAIPEGKNPTRSDYKEVFEYKTFLACLVQ